MRYSKELKLSALPHTWILDLDGTILVHNGYKNNGGDSFVPGAKEFLLSLPKEDFVIFISSRLEQYRESTEKFLKLNGVHYQAMILEAPLGERILVNDNKPSGLQMAYSCSVARDTFNIKVTVDESL